MAGSWGCPHEVNDRCTKINNLPCNPGMKGCELAGRFRFVDESKNELISRNVGYILLSGILVSLLSAGIAGLFIW